jgi:hypothetical protein
MKAFLPIEKAKSQGKLYDVDPDLLLYYDKLMQVFKLPRSLRLMEDYVRLMYGSAYSDEMTLEKETMKTIARFHTDLVELVTITYKTRNAGLLNVLLPIKERIQSTGMPDPFHYCDTWGDHDFYKWQNFPRFLSQDEVIDPVGFLTKFCQDRLFNFWKTTIQEIFSAAILNQSMASASTFIDNPVLSYTQLNKFLEASNLIRISLGGKKDR